MAGRSRVLGIERAFVPAAVAGLVLGAGACLGNAKHEDQDPPWANGGSGGSSPAGFSSAGSVPGGFGPSAGGAVSITITSNECVPAAVMGAPVFADQVYSRGWIARREFFSWTTDEQVAELRRDQVLFSRSERPGMGPGYAFTILAQLGQNQAVLDRARLAEVLRGELFAKARYAWSEPWATRMGWPGEDYGGNLLRVVLKPEAWVAAVRNGDLMVFDQQNELVPLADALANPARIGAIFYEKDAFSGGPSCGGSFVSGSNGYREFVLGNLAMVEEWSLGTQQIRDRLSANIERLTTFLERIRVCPITSSAQQWNLAVCCAWDAPQASLSELSAYEMSLAIPSDNYLAVPERIAAMIETLQGDLFEPDPLVVTPGSP